MFEPYFYKNKLEIKEKIDFILNFAIFTDKYYEKSNYQNFIKLFQKHRLDVKDVSLYYYVSALIVLYDGVSIIKTKDISNELQINNFSEKEKNILEEKIEVKELRKLFKALKVDHILTKIFYHLSILKLINTAIVLHECCVIKHTQKMEDGIFIYHPTVFPYKNLDLNSEENSSMISEIQLFANKHPNMFTSKQLKNIENPLSDCNELINLSKASNHFFKYFIDFANEDIFINHDLGKFPSNTTAFLEFDPEFFDNILMNMDTSNSKDSFSVESSIGTFGSSETGYKDNTITVLSLDVVDFVRNNLKRFKQSQNSLLNDYPI